MVQKSKTLLSIFALLLHPSAVFSAPLLAFQGKMRVNTTVKMGMGGGSGSGGQGGGSPIPSFGPPVPTSGPESGSGGPFGGGGGFGGGLGGGFFLDPRQFIQAAQGINLDMVTIINGNVFYDAANKRARFDVDSIDMDGSDFKGHVPMEATNLLLYSLDKNATWSHVEEKCICDTIDKPWMNFFKPDGATKTTGVLIDWMGQSNVQADLYQLAMDISMGSSSFGGGSTKMTANLNFYTKPGTDIPMKYGIESSTSAGGTGMDMVIYYEFDNVEPISDNRVFLPAPSCSCQATIPSSDNFPTSCPEKPSMCSCVDSSKLSFCKDFVNYPVSQVIDALDTDAFARTAYEQASPSGDCSSNYKKFVCEFYFPSCKDGELTYPVQTLLNSCPSEFISSAAKSAGPLQNYNIAAGKEAYPGANNDFVNKGSTSGDKSEEKGMPGWEIALIVVGSVGFVGLVAGGVYYRKKRQSVETHNDVERQPILKK
jgi:hypothetical protein